MPLTVSSNIYHATRAQVIEMADLCSLRHLHTSDKNDAGSFYPQYTGKNYDLFEDRNTGGGACRLVWADGIVWISRHSGYAYADITEDVCELFEHSMKCVPLESHKYYRKNPHIYP